MLARTGIEPESLELALAEADIDASDAAFPERFARIKETGVDLAIDEVGAGPGSLRSLCELPIDTIKVGKAVVELLSGNVRYAAAIRAIVTLAHDLDVQVVAKEVSTGDEVAMLQALNCDAAQGPFFMTPPSCPV